MSTTSPLTPDRGDTVADPQGGLRRANRGLSRPARRRLTTDFGLQFPEIDEDVGLAPQVIRNHGRLGGEGRDHVTRTPRRCIDATSERKSAAAALWFRKAAEQGHVHAQSNLGTLYRDGRGVAQDERLLPRKPPSIRV